MQISTDGLRITPYRGGLALCGSSLDQVINKLCPNVNLPSHPLHITLLSSDERKSIAFSDMPRIALEHIYALAHVEQNNVSWIVVVWNHADIWRRSIGLGKKQHHISVSERDDHTLDKSLARAAEEHGDMERLVMRLEGPGEDAMDHVWLVAPSSMQQHLGQRMISTRPDSFKGYIRLGESSHSFNPKLAALSYARAYSINPLPLFVKRLISLRHDTSFGPVATATELDHINPDLHAHLFHPWPDLPTYLTLHPTQSRHRAVYQTLELPRNFSYVYPTIAGMSTPRTSDNIDTLIKLGFTHILTLTAETPLDPTWFRFKPISHIYIAVPNWGAPTLAEMDIIWNKVQEGGKWVVHCGGGVGRAGTVLACLIAMMGEVQGDESTYAVLDAKTAISLLRQARPRSLESKQQEDFVAKWVSHRWKAVNANRLVEPVTLLDHTSLPKEPMCLFLIGRPGSGKSWLSEVLSKRRKCEVVSQDEFGSRTACERQLSMTYADDTLVILDRCNPKVDDRKLWLDLVDRPVVAIHFDYAKDLCAQRINQRLDHPTIRAGRGDNALDQMDRQMQPPTLTEGFAAIITITSFSAARQAIHLFSSEPGLIKFPRTPHLLNLGAKTDDDIVLPPFTGLSGNITIEEKIDGANMGISLDFDGSIRVQNRSHWISANDHAQFKPLTRWISEHEPALKRLLFQDATFSERYILYGEWMVAKHSIQYTRLPDRFLAFDLYDRLDRTFVSRGVLSAALEGTGIFQVPLIAQVDKLEEEEIHRCLEGKSVFGDSRIEGIYVRREDDKRQKTLDRSKVVRGDFIAGNEHWGKQTLVLNGLINRHGD